MAIDKELIKGSTVILILSLLQEQSMYGYEMIKAIEEQSGGIFAFKEGTLYPILHTLESDGLLQSYWNTSESGRKRKYYRITDAGKNRLFQKRKEWTVFRTAVDRVLGEGSP